MALEAEDYIGLLSSLEEDLPVVVEEEKKGPPSQADGTAATSEDWTDDPVSVKLDKIRAAFLNAKTASEVRATAQMLPVEDWLEIVIKLSPKNVQVSGDISFKHLLADMKPIDKEQYRLSEPEPKIIEAEIV